MKLVEMSTKCLAKSSLHSFQDSHDNKKVHMYQYPTVVDVKEDLLKRLNRVLSMALLTLYQEQDSHVQPTNLIFKHDEYECHTQYVYLSLVRRVRSGCKSAR